MRKLLLGTAVAALGVTAAAAADLQPLYTKAPIPVYNWTGLYVDGGFSYGVWSADTNSNVPGFTTTTLTTGGKGWLGTVGGGYDWQFGFAGYNLVGGGFGSYNFGSVKGSITDPFTASVGNVKENEAWSAGGRIGALVTPSILTYVNGGYTEAHFGGSNMVSLFGGGPVGTTSGFTHGGWFIGSGTEIMLSRGWFARAEYRYSDYGTSNVTNSIGGVAVDTLHFHPITQEVRTELVYKFNWWK